MAAQFETLVEALKEAILKADEAREKKQLLENNAPGLRPHPQDSHKSIRGGSSIKLGPDADKWSDSVTNQSVYITEWTVKYKPSVASLQQDNDVNQTGVRGKLTVAYDGEQSLEDQPLSDFAGAPVLMPTAGKCIPVHGRYVNLYLERDQATSTQDIDIEAAIVPGRPYTWFDSADDFANAGSSALVAIQTYTQRFQILTTVTVGDTLNMIDQGGNTLATFAVVANMLGVLLPLVKQTMFLRYNTADVAAKKVVFGFEIVS